MDIGLFKGCCCFRGVGMKELFTEHIVNAISRLQGWSTFYNVKLLLRWSEFVGVNQIETILFGEEEEERLGVGAARPKNEAAL